MHLKKLAPILLVAAPCLAQTCPVGTLQTGTAALTTPSCTSVSTSFDTVNRLITSGNASGTLVASTVAGMYGLRVYASTATTNSLSTVAVTLNWTENGVARSMTTSTLSLLSLSNTLSQAMPLYVDAGTAITYSVTVTGTGGGYSLHIDGRPPQV